MLLMQYINTGRTSWGSPPHREAGMWLKESRKSGHSEVFLISKLHQMLLLVLNNTMQFIQGRCQCRFHYFQLSFYTQSIFHPLLSPQSFSNTLRLSKQGFHPRHPLRERPIRFLKAAPTHTQQMYSSSQRISSY